MTVDRYTKLVLSVIAVALVAIAAENAAGPASAQSGLQRVFVCDYSDASVCASVEAAGPTHKLRID